MSLSRVVASSFLVSRRIATTSSAATSIRQAGWTRRIAGQSRASSSSSTARSFSYKNNNNNKPRTETVVVKSTWDDEDEFRPQPKKRFPPNTKASTTQQQAAAPRVVGDFQPGDMVQVEIVSFGPLGASVQVLAHLSHNPNDLIPEGEPSLATGLILQKEISYFRQGRGNIDVVRGEILPAYIERIKVVESEDGNIDTAPLKLDIGLREFGGKAKTDTAVSLLLERLEAQANGTLELGDKSPPEDIAQVFPGLSKKNFKRAVSALYKQGKVEPGPYTTTLVKK